MTYNLQMPGGSVEPIPSLLSVAAGASIGPRDTADRSPAVENWENEGGHFPAFGRVFNLRKADAPALEALKARVQSMASTLSSDFANGRVGTRFNTYQHRVRVLRRLTARLEAMRGGTT